MMAAAQQEGMPRDPASPQHNYQHRDWEIRRDAATLPAIAAVPGHQCAIGEWRITMRSRKPPERKCSRSNWIQEVSGSALKPTNWISCSPSKLPDRSIDAFEQSDRFPHKPPRLTVLRNGLARILSMLQRIFIAARSARSWRAAMHPTPFLPGHRGRHAGRTCACFGAATRAGQHRASIARMITRQSFLPSIDLEPTSASASVGAGDSRQWPSWMTIVRGEPFPGASAPPACSAICRGAALSVD